LFYNIKNSDFFNKLEVKLILEEIFGVKVVQINSLILPVKFRKIGLFKGLKKSYKKFYVTLMC